MYQPDDDMQVEMSRKVKLVADMTIRDAAQETYDAIALPVWVQNYHSVPVLFRRGAE